MTVTTNLNRKQYTGNGVTTSFATSPVVFFDSTDLAVYAVTTATGAATLLTLNTDYTVTGGAGSTGTVSTAGLYGAPSASQTLVIVRTVPLTQEADFVQNDASDAEVVEDAFDKLTMADQQLSARLDRSFTLSDSDVSGASLTVPTPAANNLVGWNSAGTALENKVPADIDLAVVTAFVETLLDDATAGAFLQTIAAAATADTAPAIDDLVFVRNTAGSVGKVTTWQNALKVINSLSADATPDATADYVLVYDASASGVKKVLLKNIHSTKPTQQVLTSGTSATYTTPAGATRIEVRMVGGGGGSGGAGGAPTAGGAGGDTSFNSIVAKGGSGGATSASGAPGAGGTGGSGSASLRIPGRTGHTFNSIGSSAAFNPGGGDSRWGFGAPSRGAVAAGTAGQAATGYGAGASGAAGDLSTYGGSGAGGGAEYVEFSINGPAATYTYSIGAAGTAGTGTSAGALGTIGLIIVDEFYD